MPKKIQPSQLLRKLQDQQYRCALTGRALSPENASPDHRVPVSKGGGHDPDNIQIVIKSANDMKGTMTMDEFVSICTDVAKYHGKL